MCFRHDIGREKFVEKVLEWKEIKGNSIFQQLKRLGASLDWQRTSFTMSDAHTKAVNEAFRICIAKGLIYRGNRLVHWSPTMRTVLSDIEVDHIAIPPGKQFREVPNGTKALVGQMFDIVYKVDGSEETVKVSTTRPETILGDVAVAVNPTDPRFCDLLNRKARLRHPLRTDLIPLVADAEGVDPSFGTGAVKITPAHDFNDFDMGMRQSLPSITIMDDDGAMKFPSESPFELTSDGETFLVRNQHRTCIAPKKKAETFFCNRETACIISGTLLFRFS